MRLVRGDTAGKAEAQRAVLGKSSLTHDENDFFFPSIQITGTYGK